MLPVVLTINTIAAVIICVYIVHLRRRIRNEQILTYFATSVYQRNTIEDIFWDVAKNCISQLKFQDCVIYQYNAEKKLLIQRAAYGPKNPEKYEILNPIEIPLGSGIVGSVALHLKSEIVQDTSKDPRYIVDDDRRLSELTVPIIIDGHLFGIIDSEHERKGFYGRWHMQMLEKMAEICSVKISKHLVEEKLRFKIARDLHDEMGSTLTSVNIISKIAMNYSNDETLLSRYLSRIKDYSGVMMETMNDIVWAINPENDSSGKLLLRMKEFAAELLEPANINYHFCQEGALDHLILSLEQRRNIYMIYREAVNNAVKYSAATELNIDLVLDESSLQVRVRDNGKGFDADASARGNGLRNMYTRSLEISSELVIDSASGRGTSVCLRVPVTSLG